ncbi:guanosine-3',5'-bis(diphosphate) 3'-pyrophosphohydrolase [Helicobacter mustelae]|uniref:Ppx/GppA phosphatase family protein n=1 Tax=Helicobacter mustelae TaxID=217 RepID=UPI000E08B210|nr:Ppx/GppA phosphatase family protein [Helicobacter mustelae]STP12155.1 guanosine-3',5'-bis(diphosphate) 3'-pyrophosphohydrolase [Helicobacter mustelae]
MAKITTVIDIGSNSVRMAVFQKTSRFGFSLIHEIKSKVRISEGSYEMGGMLQEIPMRSAISVLSDFAKIAKLYKSRKILCVATSAVRDAPNRQEFIKRVWQQCGIKVKVIDGSKEAFFGAVASANLSHNRSGVMIDIGGGSTECALIENGKIKGLMSLDIGTIRIKELFFDKQLDLKEARAFIQKQIIHLPAHFVHENIFGIGGTIRALAKMISKQDSHCITALHGYEIDVRKNLDFFHKIIKSKQEKLSDLGVSEDRQDNIQSGVLILCMLLERFKSKRITTCGVGVREGVFLADLLRSHHHTFPNGINPSLQYLKDKFVPPNGAKIKEISNKLFELFKISYKLKDSHKYLLGIAALASRIGMFVDFYHMHHHGSYMVMQILSYGFSYRERSIISLLVEFSEKKTPKDVDLLRYNIDPKELPAIQILSYILSLAKILEGTLHDKIDFEASQEVLKIYGAKNDFLLKEKVSKLSRPKNLSLLFL